MKTLKTIVTVLVILLSVQTNASNKKVKGNANVITTQRTTSDYDKIAVGGSFDVTLIDGKEGNISIDIESNLDEYLVIEVKNNTLKIHWKKGYNVRTTRGVKITVPFKDINEIALAGSGDISTKATITADDLVLKVAGSGDLNLDVDTSNVESHIAGSGTIKLNGSTGNLESNIAGSGDFEGYGLVVVEEVEAKISGSGSVETTVNGKLTARVSGSGDIYYKGSPTLDVKVSGSGSVSKR